eukprot:20877-Heterococcus_DN1.PRE.1
MYRDYDAQLLSALQLVLAKGASVDALSDTGLTPLHLVTTAAMAKLLVEAGAKVNCVDNDGRSPLHFAAGYNHTECEIGFTPFHSAIRDGQDDVCLQMLQQQQFELQRAVNGMTSLEFSVYIAAKQGTPKLLSALIARGGDVHVCCVEGLSPLMHAARGGRQRCVTLLIAAGAAVNAANALDGNKTALYYAAAGQHVEVAQSLLKRGAAPNAVIAGTSTALCEACRVGSVAVCRALLAAGAHSTGALSPSSTLQLPDAVLPLHALVEAPDEAAAVQIAKLLLARNAPVDSPDSQCNTALMLAVSSSKLQLAAALLKTGASTAARSSSGRTALHCAAQAGSAAAVQLLVKHYGADAAAAAAAAGCFDGKGRGFLPLHYACKAGHVQAAAELVKLGHVNIPRKCCAKHQWPPLRFAVHINSPQLTTLLLAHGAAVDQLDGEGQTALTHASNAQVTRLLLEAGASLTATCPQQRATALHHAAHRGCSAAVLCTLLKAGADPTALCSFDGAELTPAGVAVLGGFTAAVQLLQRAEADAQRRRPSSSASGSSSSSSSSSASISNGSGSVPVITAAPPAPAAAAASTAAHHNTAACSNEQHSEVNSGSSSNTKVKRAPAPCVACGALTRLRCRACESNHYCSEECQ